MIGTTLSVRLGFTENKSALDSESVAKHMKELEEAEEFLKVHLVQGRLNQSDRYEFNAEQLDEAKITKKPQK